MNKNNVLEILNILQCPISNGDLEYIEDKHMLFSKEANVFYPIKEGIIVLLEEEAIKEEDLEITSS